MNTTRYRTVRALASAIMLHTKLHPKSSLEAHSRPLEDFSPLRTLDEKAHLYAATYVEEESIDEQR